jgi:hypothetical protein
MHPNRWFYLRHTAEKFSDEHFACVEAGFHVWAATVRGHLEVWDKVPDYRSFPPPRPTYEFGQPELSSDRSTITLPLGGEPAYVGLKVFEDYTPWEFTYFLPMWFRLDLEHARRDTLGWFPEPKWLRFFTPEKADEMRKQGYKRPIATSASKGSAT